MHNNRIVIIMVNWNAPAKTLACLDSLRGQAECAEIVLLDNGSTDDSVTKITAWATENAVSLLVLPTLNGLPAPTGHPLTLVTLPDNLGFGKANNLGMAYAIRTGADFVLLLNNDTVVTPGFLGRLVAIAAKAARPGIIGCTIRYFDQPKGIWFGGGKINARKGAFYHRHTACQGVATTDFVTGCLMLIPCPVLQTVGLFDDRFFLNVEDIDLSCRVAEAGYDLLVDCDTVIYHKVSASIGGLYSARNQYYFHRNRMLFFENRLKGWRWALFLLTQFGLLIPGWFGVQMLCRRFPAMRGALQGYIDYWHGRTGKDARP